MAWGRIDDDLYDHPKRWLAGVEAMGAWVILVSYAGKYRRADIPKAKALVLVEGKVNLLAALVRARLLDETDELYRLHDWEEYQPKGEDPVQRREHASKAAKARWARRMLDAQPNAQSTNEHTMSNARAEVSILETRIPLGVSDAPSRTHPVPVPFLVTTAGEFSREESWELIKNRWLQAGVWWSGKGEKEKVATARNVFNDKVNSKNWAEVFQGVDWAVSDCLQSGNREMLGTLHQFLQKSKWKDVQAPSEVPVPKKEIQFINENWATDEELGVK